MMTILKTRLGTQMLLFSSFVRVLKLKFVFMLKILRRKSNQLM